jgi:hypothetical protein
VIDQQLPDQARDRDDAGRARNARPRDGLGRPLAPGAVGVQRQPEGVVRSPTETLVEAQRLIDAGMPFHAHEVLEDAWKSSPDEYRELWRGLAQLAVGLTHAARQNPVGAVALLRRAVTSIEPYRDQDVFQVDVVGLIRWADQAETTITLDFADGGKAAADVEAPSLRLPEVPEVPA